MWNFLRWLDDLLENIWAPPAYDKHPSELSMNHEVEKPKPMPPIVAIISNREKLYSAAKLWLGRDASPADITPDTVACVDTLSHIIHHALPELNFPLLDNTRALYQHLIHSHSFVEVGDPLPGDIILCVTGTGNGSVAHGHCGIVAKYGILSNDSRSGLFLENYTIESWKMYFEKKGGFTVFFYRVI